MRRIYKYHLKTTYEQIIKVPILTSGYYILDFQNQILKLDVQHGELCMWCIVDVSQEGFGTPTITLDRKIFIVGTGNDIPAGLTKENYIGTYQLDNGDFIGHVFV